MCIPPLGAQEIAMEAASQQAAIVRLSASDKGKLAEAMLRRKPGDVIEVADVRRWACQSCGAPADGTACSYCGRAK